MSEEELAAIGVDELIEGMDDSINTEGEEIECQECVGVIEGRVPASPSEAERVEHDKTHLPFKAWCPVCVAAKADIPPHRRVQTREDPDRRPRISIDYMFINSEESERVTPVMVIKHSKVAKYGRGPLIEKARMPQA